MPKCINTIGYRIKDFSLKIKTTFLITNKVMNEGIFHEKFKIKLFYIRFILQLLVITLYLKKVRWEPNGSCIWYKISFT